jgi:magnesium transporter
MRSIFVHRDGVTRQADAVDPAWLAPDASEVVWVNIDQPVEDDRPLLQGVFHLHELAVEDALSAQHHPKIESYDGFLYLILHDVGLHGAQPHGLHPAGRPRGADNDIDFFLGRNFLVTVHTAPSAPIEAEQTVCAKHHSILGEGPVSLMHRIIDAMVDQYPPLVDRLEECLDELERMVFDNPNAHPLKGILALKSDVASLRRVAVPERDAVGRLARREFAEIPEQMAYRFRDVYDHLVRLTEEAMFFQDRVTGLLDAYLSTQSNRMNQVMKVLTLIATIFMPLTVLTGMYGMNVSLPHLPGGDAVQFWWIVAMMVGVSGLMVWLFRRMRWL